MRDIINFRAPNRLCELNLLRAGESRDFNKRARLPVKPAAARTKLIQHRIKQSRRRSNRAIRSERDVNFLEVARPREVSRRLRTHLATTTEHDHSHRHSRTTR